MHGTSSTFARVLLALTAVALMAAALASPAGAKTKYLKVQWMKGYKAPGTPKSLDRVGIVKVGSSKARNVLVIEPGTSGGGAYFVPLAKWIVEKEPEWQVWAVERRENLLEEQKEAQKFKEGKVSGTEFFNYYLGYLGTKVKKHYEPVTGEQAKKDGAKEWGMNVAVNDLHTVIDAAKKLKGKVVLAGHSLGGSVVTAYATWDFEGKPGAEGLSGLVYIDGGSSPTAITKTTAEEELAKINPEKPWLAFGGIAAPDLGLFSLTGAAAALENPTEASVAEEFAFLPPELKAKNSKGEDVKADNEAEFGYSVNVGTSPPNLAAAQVHAGKGLQEPISGEIWTWNGEGALTPIRRYAEMLAGAEVKEADGTEWYFPERLTVDTGAVGNGIPNEAEEVLGLHSIYGESLPTTLHILAINSELDKDLGGGFTTLTFAEDLAKQSGIPMKNLTLINEEDTYAHNDPNGAYPTNAFVEALIPFLNGLSEY
jgi:pimeloyl-ACP methyl ester carboxylesterase